jgi:ribose transport system substrate-binding protein
MYGQSFPRLLLLFAVSLGCSRGQPESAASPDPSNASTADRTSSADADRPAPRGVIGFSALTLKNPFFKIIADTMTVEGEKHGFTVIVNDAERNPKTQAQHVDSYIAQNVTAIVLNPVDREAVATAIKAANDAGIPVFTCDLQCEAEGITIAGHVGTDNVQGGRLAAQAMLEALQNQPGKVLILHFAQANSCVERVQGFREVMDAHNTEHPDAAVEMVELEGGGLQDEGFRATADALVSHPDLRGIFAINDPSALGAWTALKQAGKQDQVVIVGFDGQLEGKQAIRDGKFYADPIQFPDQMGIITVQNIARYLDGEEFEPVQLIPTELYRKADAERDPALN